MSTIDTTGIDETKPQTGSATTASVRDNFAAIKAQLAVAQTEIGALEEGKATVEAVTDLGLPAATAGTYLRRNAGNTAYEAKTPQQVADELDPLLPLAALNLGKDTTLAAEALSGTLLTGAMLAAGAIVEQGSNANGEYWRWESGLQVCYHNGITLTKGSGFSQATWTYPAQFSSPPKFHGVSMNMLTADGGTGRTSYSMGTFVPGVADLDVAINLLDGATAQSGDWTGNRVLAIGSWK